MPATASIARRAAAPAAPQVAAPRTPTARITLRTFGECRIIVEHPSGTTALTPASDRLFALLLLLAAEPGRTVLRARAAAWLWPDLPEIGARHALRQLVYRLRRLGVAVDGDAAQLTLIADVRAPQHDALLADDPPRTGRCLPGWDPPGDALRDWVDRYRATAEASARAALAHALTRALATPPAAHRPDAVHRPDAPHTNHVALAAALLELDPQHPLARATLARPRAAREPSPTADALPCVGRDDLLHTLHAHASASCDGHGSAVVLAAAPGMGVSRIIAELAHTTRPLGVTLAISAARARTPSSIPHALATAVHRLLDRPGALGCAPDALRITRRFVATPLLPIGDTAVRRLGTAIADLARAVGNETPVLLAVDARCATPSERILAATVARALAGSAVLAVFTAIPATPCTFGALGAVTNVIPVPPLTDHAAATLATAVARVNQAALQPDDLTWCITMGRGRPADVIALAHACTTRPGSRTLPPALAMRLRDYVAALPTRTRRVAALCTLLGDTDVADRAARALGGRRSALDAALSELRRANLPGDPLADDPRPTHRDAVRLVGATALTTLDPGERDALIAHAARERAIA